MDALSFYTVENIGPHRSLTTEGYLLCEAVPVARTGTMVYGPNEVPVTPGLDGLVHISRDDEALFDATFLASLNGKPVTDDHPDEDVNPENWTSLAKGFGMNARRGGGFQTDLILMDLLITDKNLVAKLADHDKEEISLGYEANYEEVKPGVGRQVGLLANHIAVVDRGRCGPRCSIGDRHPAITTNEGEVDMRTRDKSTVIARRPLTAAVRRVVDAVRTGDEEEIKKAEEGLAKAEDELADELEKAKDNEAGGIHLHLGGSPEPTEGKGETKDDGMEEYVQQNNADHEEFRRRLDALESQLSSLSSAGTDDSEQKTDVMTDSEAEEVKDEMPEEEEGKEKTTKDSVRKMRDSNSLAATFKATISAAEIIAPGLRVPTFDAAAKPVATVRAIHAHRCLALDAAYMTTVGRELIDAIHGRTLDTKSMSKLSVRTLFRATAASMRARNNDSSTKTSVTTTTQVEKPGIKTNKDLNAMYAKHYGLAN